MPEKTMPRKPMKKILHAWFPPVYEWYQRELIRRVADAVSLVDLGCGYNSHVQFLDKHVDCTGVDLFGPYLEKSKAAHIHNRYVRQDIRDLSDFKDHSFDVAYSSDVIEHLTKEEGMALIRAMERIAKKRVIISTPNGYRHQEEHDGNELQVHKSAWSADEFERMGFQVFGMDGFRALRADESRIRFHPRRFWSLVANITQFFVYRRPQSAYSLFCVKELS